MNINSLFCNYGLLRTQDYGYSVYMSILSDLCGSCSLPSEPIKLSCFLVNDREIRKRCKNKKLIETIAMIANNDIVTGIEISTKTMSITVEMKKKGFFIIEAQQSLSAFRPVYHNAMLSLSKCNHASYGFITNLASDCGPSFYGMGISCGAHTSLRNYNNAYAVSHWGHTIMPNQEYADGVIRDLYECNIFNSVQAKAQVFEMTLEKWLTASKSATIEWIGDHFHVEIRDGHLDRLRAEFRQGCPLYHRNKYNIEFTDK